jgi:hypothetical protein
MFKPNRVFKKPLTIVYSGDPDFLASTTSPPNSWRRRWCRTGNEAGTPTPGSHAVGAMGFLKGFDPLPF